MSDSLSLSCPFCGKDVPAGAKACPHCGAVDKGEWREDTGAYSGIDLPGERSEHDALMGPPLPVETKPRWTREMVMKATAILMLVIFMVLSVFGALFY